MFLHSSLFFPPTKNASASRKAHAYMPWPVWRSPCCAATEERCFPPAKAPQSKEPESMRSDLGAARCRLQRSKPYRPAQEKDAGERAKKKARGAVLAGSRSSAVVLEERKPHSSGRPAGDMDRAGRRDQATCERDAVCLPPHRRCSAGDTGSHQTDDQILFSLFRLVL
jgi:hypothetical protein